MDDNYISFEEKNLRKFSIEIDQPNYLGLNHPQFEVYKEINYAEEEKPQNNSTQNKNNSNTTNIFYISNIKDNSTNENKTLINSKNILDTQNKSNHQSLSEEKQKILNNSKENENSDSNANEYHSGRWTNEEHQKFIEGILKHGNEWKRVQSVIKTRSSTQARSHAQKFFLRMKKEISPKILADPNLLIQYIINSTFKSKNNIILTNEQKDRLISVIRSNLKSEETLNKNTNINSTNNQEIIKEKENLDDNYINEEEDDTLGYNKVSSNNVMSKKMSISDIGEKRKITFCSKKRKNSSDYILNSNDNKIFNIKKDMSHKRSMDITKQGKNLVNKLAKNNIEIKIPFNELNNYNNISKNNLFISNNNNNNTGNIHNYTNTNNSNTNFIIQNNYYNIINNYNNKISNNGMFNNNNNVNNINNPINNLPNNFINNNINNDSINSDQNKHYNNIDIFKYKDKNYKNNNEILEHEKNNITIKNPLENYMFFNNENFFPNSNKIKHYDNDNSYKNYDNTDVNDPFYLNFGNVNIHNDNINDNNTLNNDNDNEEECHYNYELEFDRINFGRNNSSNDNVRPYDD